MSTTFLATERLLIDTLSNNDNHFIFELVNTEGWIKFIGNRHINSPFEAIAYIQKIIDNPAIDYWVVKLKDDRTPIGVISFIKRTYLHHYDIGFAFLPSTTKNGYAYEAANAVLKKMTASNLHTHILATTIPENVYSIKLLKKLGLAFEHEIENEGNTLHVYKVAVDAIGK